MTRARLTHLDARNVARMVDVGAKPPTHRVAVAEAFVRAATPVLDALEAGSLQKGDALAVARLAGILAAKRTSELIPLAHPVALTHVAVDVILERERGGVRIEARCETIGATGVEMEALTAASTAALTIYDMAKSIDRAMVIEGLQLVMKSGGKSGTFRRKERRGETTPAARPPPKKRVAFEAPAGEVIEGAAAPRARSTAAAKPRTASPKKKPTR